MIAASSSAGGGAGIAGPLGSHVSGELLGPGIAGPRKGENPAPLVTRYLGHDMGGGAEAKNAQTVPAARHHQRAIPDQPGAQQRRGSGRIVWGRDPEAKVLVRKGKLRVAAIDRVAGETGRIAEILLPP